METLVSGREAIDRLRQGDGSLTREAVRSVLPYGDAFLFVDRALVLDDRSIEAVYTVPTEASWIQAHFPGMPVMPGALVAEGLGQAGTLILRYGRSTAGKDLIGLAIDRARFHEPARPGDLMTYRVRVTTLGSRAARLEGTATVGERRIGSALFVVGFVEREALQKKLKR
jgi:3-hydroxyacyl-[acyl-carrier-protein] dehydratase